MMMQKEELARRLTSEYAAFAETVRRLPATQQQASAAGKWSAAQVADHLHRSLKPLVLAFRLPPFLLRLFFGKANRPSRGYEELVQKYQLKLAAGGRAGRGFVPPAQVDAGIALTRMTSSCAQLAARISAFSEAQLDQLILPHPLLGKLTLREMIYFTAYHACHHRLQIG